MAITLKGIRVEELNIQRTAEGAIKVANASYSLISSADKVLAKQTIGGYNGSIALEVSKETTKALETFMSLYKADITATLGLEEAS